MPQPNPLTIGDVLDKAADLIEPEGAWTQEAYGRDANGLECQVVEEAVCFCAMGAIYKAAGKIGEFEHDADLIAPLALLLDEGIDDWNDAPGRTQAEVVAKLREAAAKARESAQ